MKKPWNKDMHDQLKDFQKKAPEGLLDDIKSEMNRCGLFSSPIADNPQRIFPLVLRSVVSMAAVLLILFGFSHFGEKQTSLPVVSKYPEVSQKPVLPTHVAEEKTLEEPSSAKPSSKLIAKAEKMVTSPSSRTFEKEEVSLPKQAVETKDKEEKQPQNKDAKETKKENKSTSSKPKWTYNVSKRKKPSFSFGVYYSGVVVQSNLKFNQGDSFGSSSAFPEMDGPNNHPDMDGDNPEGSDHNGGADTISVVSSRGTHSASDIYNFRGKTTHHLPIKLGISIRYDLNERWKLQSGLTYSYLASDLEGTRQEDKYNIKQKLHYIGIPVQVGYRIWKGKQFRSYIVAGGQVEKLISGKASIRHSKKRLLQKTSIQNVSDKKLLFSALASIGAEYMLSNDFSLYVEPGIHYYFKNGNRLQTHYNEQPLNINLNVGFRFHWKK